jgi:hypothetical protein
MHDVVDCPDNLSIEGAVEKSDFNITITPAQVEAWKKELADLTKTMAANQERYHLLIQRINAVGLYFDPPQNGRLPLLPGLTNKPITEMGPKEVIVHWLKRYAQPVTVKVLRDSIEESGYPLNNFGRAFSYYYTLLKRMEQSGEVIRSGDKITLRT